MPEIKYDSQVGYCSYPRGYRIGEVMNVNANQCRVACDKNPDCHSYEFGKIPGNNPKGKCILLDANNLKGNGNKHWNCFNKRDYGVPQILVSESDWQLAENQEFDADIEDEVAEVAEDQAQEDFEFEE